MVLKIIFIFLMQNDAIEFYYGAFNFEFTKYLGTENKKK